MIQETRTHTCRGCGSPNIVKNGTNRSGSPQYHCKECGVYRVLKPKQASSETERQRVLRACLQRCSLRGVERIFDMARQTVTQWIKAHVQHAPDFRETLLPAAPDDVLELDEIWSFVRKKEDPRWVWTALYRRTRQIVAFAIGDRSKATYLRLWKSIPEEYKHCHTFSRSSLQRPMVVSEKKRERQHIENDGTTPYVNELVATFDKHCPFPNLMSIMRELPSGFFFSTT